MIFIPPPCCRDEAIAKADVAPKQSLSKREGEAPPNPIPSIPRFGAASLSLRFAHLLTALLLLNLPVQSAEGPIDLARAIIFIAPGSTGPEKKAALMLAEEVTKRTQVRWAITESWPADSIPIIVMGSISNLSRLTVAPPPSKAGREGYRITTETENGRTLLWIEGTDSRGVLFGVGRLLRSLNMEERKITLPAKFDITSQPQESLRGHQLGYRPKCNSYDAWDVPTWEQYIRDLIVFGCNAIELIPPRSDDDPTSPTFRCRRWK